MNGNSFFGTTYQHPQTYNCVDNQVYPSNTPDTPPSVNNGVVYYTVAELPAYQEGTTLAKVGEIITQLLQQSTGTNWRNAFDAITHMRVLNKNFPEHVNSIFSNFGMQILDNIEGVKTCTLKNTLLFINEVFISSRIVTLNSLVIEKFVPILLQKSIDESKLISLPAQEALLTFSVTCNTYDSAYITLIKLAVLHKAWAVQDIALKMIKQLITYAKENLTKLEGQTFTFLMKGLTQTISSARSSTKAFSKQVMETMAEVIGNQNYMNMMENVLTREEQLSIQSNYEEQFNKQTKTKSRDPNINRKSISQFKVHSKKSMAPELRSGVNIIEIKMSNGEQFQSILQEQSSNAIYQQQQQGIAQMQQQQQQQQMYFNPTNVFQQPQMQHMQLHNQQSSVFQNGYNNNNNYTNENQRNFFN